MPRFAWSAALLCSLLPARQVLAGDVPLAPEQVPVFLEAAWKQSAETRTEHGPAAAEAELRTAAERVVADLGRDHDVSQELTSALADAATIESPSQRLSRLSVGMVKAQAAARFRPTMEAPLPEGFPQPGPVGRVIVKEYPAYRAARTPMDDPQRRGGSAGQNSAFNRLFDHITSNDVKMTAPVEMVYDAGVASLDATGPAPRPVSMAFLYEHPAQGEAGDDGSVEVVDLPPVTVVSVGVRGYYTAERMRESMAKLEAFLAEHAATWEVAGPVRYMGYNSPFVLPHLRYGEVQIPVRAKSSSDGR
jgi:hypothetical protein